jgi:WhiB family redox-sensing transcriptional regulator
VREEHWKLSAACLGADTNDFFSPAAEVPPSVIAMCADCPVSEDCLQYAIELNIEYGVFGGLTAYQRTKKRR